MNDAVTGGVPDAAGIELSVVLSTLGNYSGLARVLDGYERQNAAAASFEVVVVIDSADPEPERAHAAIGNRSYPVQVVRGTVPGLSANRNAGWQAAAAGLVLFTDNDTIPEPRLVIEHVGWHQQHQADEVAVLGHVRWAREVRVNPFMRWLDHGMQFDYPSIVGIEAGWGRFYGANVSVKRAFVERVGGFDEQRLPYLYDDLDFAYRASKLGLRVLYNRAAVVEHLREVDLSYWRQRMERAATAEREFVEKHPELDPYFFRMFSHARGLPPARGRGRHVIRAIPRSVPWLGKRAWTSADLYYRQQLAPYFLDAWERRGSESAPAGGGVVAPYLLDRDAVGSSPGVRPRPRNWRKLPWYVWYELGWRIATKLRLLLIRATHRHCRVEFQGPVRLGPGFRLEIPDAGTFIVGPGVDFRRGFVCEISGDGRVVIGAGTTFTFHGLVRCSTAIEIGEGCAFGQATLIVDDQRAPGPDGQGSTRIDSGQPLRIGNGVGVGDKATIQADVGERAMIASQAVVTRPIPAYCVGAGAPARVVRYFGPEDHPPGRS